MWPAVTQGVSPPASLVAVVPKPLVATGRTASGLCLTRPRRLCRPSDLPSQGSGGDESRAHPPEPGRSLLFLLSTMRTTWPKFTEVRRELHVQAHQRVATERRAVLLQLIKTLPATARTQA